MLDFFLELNLYLFYFINTYISNPIFDVIFVFFHAPHKQIWLILIILFLWILYAYKDKKNRIFLILFLPIGLIITDQIGSLIKDSIPKHRPYMKIEKEKINLLIKIEKNENETYKNTKSSRSSFPSNHSANIFFISFLLSHIYKKNKKYFFTLALLIAISRIYIGVHYPIDVIVGGMIGITIAYSFIKIYDRLIR